MQECCGAGPAPGQDSTATTTRTTTTAMYTTSTKTTTTTTTTDTSTDTATSTETSPTAATTAARAGAAHTGPAAQSYPDRRRGGILLCSGAAWASGAAEPRPPRSLPGGASRPRQEARGSPRAPHCTPRSVQNKARGAGSTTRAGHAGWRRAARARVPCGPQGCRGRKRNRKQRPLRRRAAGFRQDDGGQDPHLPHWREAYGGRIP